MKRRIGTVKGILLVLACFPLLFGGEGTAFAEKREGFPPEKRGVRPSEVTPAKMKIILQYDYAGGERSEIVLEVKGPFHRWLGAYRDWNLSDVGTDHVVLSKKMGGRSPLHFSVTGKEMDLFQGFFELFNHPSFFQFDPERMEAKATREDPAGFGERAFRQG